MSDNRHLSTHDLAAYLDGRLPSALAADAERHLAACSDCRADLVAARRTTDSTRAVRPIAVVTTLAAAALLLAAPRLIVRTAPAPDRERAAPRLTERLGVIAPASVVTLSTRPVEFAWHGGGAGALYRLSLADSAGRQLWSVETADTTASWTPDRRNEPGTAYLWYVDAVLANGQTLSSGTQRFTIAR